MNNMRQQLLQPLLSILLLGLFFNVHSQYRLDSDVEKKQRESIYNAFESRKKECSYSVDAVTNFNEKKEFWNICNLLNQDRIIQIQSHHNSVYYKEIYFEKNGKLVYAEESEQGIPDNHYVQITWKCQYYAEDGKIVSHMSLGHGKTEFENWEAESIFDLYRKRLAEFNKIKK